MIIPAAIVLPPWIEAFVSANCIVLSKSKSCPGILDALVLQASVLLLVVDCSRKSRRRRAALGATRHQLVYLVSREPNVDESMAVKMFVLSAVETNLARVGLIVLVVVLVCHRDS